MGRPERRQLIRLGRGSRDAYTALGCQAVAMLGTGRSTPQVAAALDLATSTVVRAADRFLADGIEGRVTDAGGIMCARPDAQLRGDRCF
jgi:hypothetical protein